MNIASRISNIAPRAMRQSLRTANKMNIGIRRIAVASRMRLVPRKYLHRGIYQICQRSFSGGKPLAKPGEFNIIQRKGHGLKNYYREWETLIFTDPKWAITTVWVWGPSAFATVIMFWCIWNSVMRDPEVRLRPHKKAWHITPERIASAEKYQGGAFEWIPIRKCWKRMEYIRKRNREGFDEPGQTGWQEDPIPKLDDDE